MLRILWTSVPALLLAACGTGSEEPTDPATESEVAGGAEAGGKDATTTAATKDEFLAADEAATAAAKETEMAVVTDGNSIPVQFHGKWDATTGSCVPDSDGRMEVSAKEVSFYESVGDVTKIEQDGKGVKVTLAMQGEGEEWVEEYTLTLNGNELVTSTGMDAFPRKRCP